MNDFVKNSYGLVLHCQKGGDVIMRDEKKQDEISERIEKYCGNDMALLKKMCYPLLRLIGGISEADYDDFYSIANETVWRAAVNYDPKNQNQISFEVYLRGCLSRKFKTEMTKRNRDRRIPRKQVISIEEACGLDGRKLEETIKSDFDMNEEIPELRHKENLQVFLSGLSKKQHKIAVLIMEGYTKDDILKRLDMTSKRYDTCLGMMKSFDTMILLMNNED